MEQKNKYLRHGEKQYNLILSTAEKIFVEQGIEKVKLSDIVEECGIMRATFYRYFKNKEELLWHIMRTHTTDFFQKLEDKIGSNDCTTFDKFEKFINLLCEGFDCNPNSYIFIDLFKDTYLNATSHEDSELLMTIYEEDDYHTGDTVKFFLENFYDGSVKDVLDPKITAVSILYSSIIIVSTMAKQTATIPAKYQIQAGDLVRFSLNALLDSIRP
ncbi:TetR/AcrR family transcriptional regulator [[Clostridium] fimetarium]|uniref:DNA-binding transcriptional regulator, AcrR family n=1 Tax=[Clostridium] fimetarium TaxID=99656 RepID=A0A1I0NQ26_9FIRM|nr:TetR/AcrR family transcriptional regulator [[Clostridium] fimetarium]SEW03664.1 DNA-binding transcriptional regulator, AcrR family [[Clostridium] fimetarium]